MDKGPVSIEWFSGAETNIAYNCLDRHVEAGKGDKIAMYWEGNDLVSFIDRVLAMIFTFCLSRCLYHQVV